MSGPILFAKTAEGLFFKPAESDSHSQGAVVKLSAKDQSISVVENKIWETDVATRSISMERIAALLGFIRLKLNTYAVIANKIEETGKFNGHSFFKVVSFLIVPSTSGGHQLTDADEAEYLKLLNLQLNNATLFFSYTYDTTNSLQRNEVIQHPSWKTADERFFWNNFLTRNLQDLAKHDPRINYFIQPIIYGYIKFVPTTLNNVSINVGIITRRSRHRAGTRYFRRGVDELGHVGNFNETEQILVVNGSASSTNVFAFLETRGSVPVKWAEINNLQYKPKLVVANHPTLKSTEIHFDEQKKIYGKNYLINLVNQKGHELPIKEAYESAVHSLNDDEISYTYFDFHHECRKMQWHKVKLLIPILEKKGFKNSDYFHKIIDSDTGKTEKVLNLQRSVIRTNCMDCLDRTNVVQSVFANWVMQNQLEASHVLHSGEEWQSNKTLLSFLQNLWADNADAVSVSYSGTGALKTDYTRTGNRTRKGAFKDFVNSASRYYQNNLTDGPRQDSYDLFLGNFKPYRNTQSPFADERPLHIQFVPTLLYAALTVLFATIFFPKSYFSSSKNLFFFFSALATLAGGLHYIFKNGLQYVHWPKLVNVDFLDVYHTHEKDSESKTAVFSMNEAFVKPTALKKD